MKRKGRNVNAGFETELGTAVRDWPQFTGDHVRVYVELLSELFPEMGLGQSIY